MTRDPNTAFLGHPRGLATLFFTEMWERFSYYGMRALLILFMTDSAAGGLGLDAKRAGAIYGLYTFGVYATALLGGWVADRLTGQRRAVLYGGILIAIGHYLLAVPATATFYPGLVSIALGTGLLKPNVSAIVGDLYAEKGARRDAGFSIFYMGINLGAFLGPLLCSWLGEPREGAPWVNWHYGFGAAGVGMTLALIQYVVGQKHLLGAGELKEDSALPERIADARKKAWIALAAAGVLIAAFWALLRTGVLTLSVVELAGWTGGITVALALLYFAWVIAFLCRDALERRRVALCAMLFIGAAMFWSGFEQAGSSMNLFARDFTDRVLFGREIPAGMLQSVNSTFLILLAPVVGSIWLWLGARNPSIPVKFGIGLALLGAGFLVMAWGATQLPEHTAGPGASALVPAEKVGMRWLVATYFLHTVGELCLSPVGLSSVTKLSPARLVGQMMGTWFMGLALGNLIAGQISGAMESLPLVQLFGAVAAIAALTGVVFFVLARPLNWLAAGIK